MVVPPGQTCDAVRRHTGTPSLSTASVVSNCVSLSEGALAASHVKVKTPLSWLLESLSGSVSPANSSV